jgi:hypothetical protein
MKKLIKSLLLLLITSLSYSQVVINELDSDTPSVDDKEFIELKSVTPYFSLNNHVLVLYNGNGSVCYYVIDLSGLTTDINGIVTIGHKTLSPIADKFIPENIFQNGPDAVALYTGIPADFPINSLATNINLIDALVYGSNHADATDLMNRLGVLVQWNEASNGSATLNSLQRKPDGTFEAKLPTPGANNDNSGFIYNGIRVSSSVNQIVEGQSFVVTFSTQRPVTTDLNFNFSLNNNGFNTADYTGLTSLIIPAGSSTVATTITTVDDDLDESDEIAIIKIGNLPSEYNRLSDFIEVRVTDNDFSVAPFGTPLQPTYGIVQSTAPQGYYDSLEGLSGDQLKQAIQDIIANPDVVRAHSYGDVIEILNNADQNPANSNQVWLMYVERGIAKLEYQTGSSNVGKWNREHIYPQSRGGFANATSDTPDGINIWLPTGADDITAGHSDAHHLRAEDGPENSSRSNKDYGLTGYNGPAGTRGSWKGDVARALFYMAVRYNSLDLANGDLADTTVGRIGDLATLLQWNLLDPSDDFEMNRNNYIYTWQYNRNPFIDYPSLADYIWGENTGQPWYSTLSNQSNIKSIISVFPNPSNAHFSVVGIDEFAKIQLYNTLGALVFEQDFEGVTTFNPQLNSGVYIVKIKTNQSEFIKRLIIK